MKKRIIILLIIISFTHTGIRLYEYFSPAEHHEMYRTSEHYDDTLRIAYIGDSWALGHSDIWTFGHNSHSCRIADLISEKTKKPAIVESYGIGGLTSKEVYNALFEIDNLKRFMKKGYDYCFISAGINDTHKKMSTSYYKISMDCIIQFLLTNHIHPIILEIPDYNIIKIFDDLEFKKLIIRKFSMIINKTPLDCKQLFRDALDELIVEKGYQNKVSIVRYKSWNNCYQDDLKELYIEDQMHLNEKGYSVLDSVIAYEIIKHYSNPY